MITIKNIKEMEKYYNEKTNTYVFYDDVDFYVDIQVHSSIKAMDIKAEGNLEAWDIKAIDIDASDICAWNIEARNITAKNISYYAVCFAYQNIICETIKGERKNAKHFCLDGEIRTETTI